MKFKRLKFFLKRKWYRIRHNIEISMNKSIMPIIGKGKYVSVIRKGNFIDIINEEEENSFIRIIPYQPNHGIMVEKWINNKLNCRNLLDYRQLSKNSIYFSNIEGLIKNKININE